MCTLSVIPLARRVAPHLAGDLLVGRDRLERERRGRAAQPGQVLVQPEDPPLVQPQPFPDRVAALHRGVERADARPRLRWTGRPATLTMRSRLRSSKAWSTGFLRLRGAAAQGPAAGESRLCVQPLVVRAAAARPARPGAAGSGRAGGPVGAEPGGAPIRSHTSSGPTPRRSRAAPAARTAWPRRTGMPSAAHSARSIASGLLQQVTRVEHRAAGRRRRSPPAAAIPRSAMVGCDRTLA